MNPMLGQKALFNGIKRGMGFIRFVGRRDPYKLRRKLLKRKLKNVRKLKKHLKHVARRIKHELHDMELVHDMRHARHGLFGFLARDVDENRYEDKDANDALSQQVFSESDERGLLLYSSIGTEDFNDIWNDDNQWMQIEDMKTWNGADIKRKCLTIWKQRLCLCQFLSWLDGPEKYHCLLPHSDQTYDDHYYYQNHQQNYKKLQVKSRNPQVIVHHFHHIYAAKQVTSDDSEEEAETETVSQRQEEEEKEDAIPKLKPNWLPVWMWQDIQTRRHTQHISNMLFADRSGSASHAETAYAYEYYDDDDDDDAKEEAQEMSMNMNMKQQDAWIEIDESATHDYDTQWEDDAHWDEVQEMRTWEGTAIRRKCLFLWRHRLCLCQFLGWLDTNKYKCIYHHQQYAPRGRQLSPPPPMHPHHVSMPHPRPHALIDMHMPPPYHHPHYQHYQHYQHDQHYQHGPIGHYVHAHRRPRHVEYEPQHPIRWQHVLSHNLLQHDQRISKLVQEPHTPIYADKQDGSRKVVAQYIHPHGKPMMIGVHHDAQIPYEPSRPQWVPQVMLHSPRHSYSYMVHPHPSRHDESDYEYSTQSAAAKLQQYDDMYHNYDYDDAFAFDFDALYEQFGDEDDEEDDAQQWMNEHAVDTFVDDMENEWVMTDALNELEYTQQMAEDARNYFDDVQTFATSRGKLVHQKCVHIFKHRKSCICGYEDESHFHCHRKNAFLRRRKYYLNTKMPRHVPTWMSAHDFAWLKDQRLSAFDEVLPDALMQHIERNRIYTIPFAALSKLVSPAVAMQHATWHKTAIDAMGNVASARSIDENMYGDYYYDDDDAAMSELGSDDEEADTYIIDEFYNALDGSKWVVTNEWTTDLDDIWKDDGDVMDNVQIYAASAGEAAGDNMGGDGGVPGGQNTDVVHVLSSACTMVFGRLACLCDLVNWAARRTLYRCYQAHPSQTNGQQQQQQQQQQPPNTMAGNAAPAVNAGMNQEPNKQQVINTLSELQKTIQDQRRKIDELIAKNGGQNGGQNGGAQSTSHQGWGSAMVDDYSEYSEYDADADSYVEDYNNDGAFEGYDNDDAFEAYDNDDAYAEMFSDDEEAEKEHEAYNAVAEMYDSYEKDGAYDEYDDYEEYDDDDDEQEVQSEVSNADEEYQDYYYNGYAAYDKHNEYGVVDAENTQHSSNVRPNWSTEGEGFTQTVFIGVNTFWGLMLLSIFFGMVACSMVCAYLHFKQLFWEDGKLLMEDRNAEIQHLHKSDSEYATDVLHPIEEHISFSVDKSDQQ